jgi:hypothetical protein
MNMKAVARFDTESAEGSRTCQILILCEDVAAYERATDVCWRILVQLADDLDFSFNCWNFYELSDPQCMTSVTRSTKFSDVILLSLHQPQLPDVAEKWLDSFTGHRPKAEGILALVLNEPAKSPEAVNKLVTRLEQCAQRMGMDFLSPGSTKETPAKRNGFEAVLPAKNNYGERANDHWGLNE